MASLNSLIAGAALLGKWTDYKPVVYRIFYEERDSGKRSSLLVLSRLGFLAVTAALFYKYRASRAVLSIIAPITLITVGKNNIGEVKDLFQGFPGKFCSHIIRSLQETASLNGQVASESAKNASSTNPVEKLKELIKKSGSKKKVIVIKQLKCPNNPKNSPQNSGEKELPAVCHYSCELSYDISPPPSPDKESEERINIDVYIVVVPNTMATRIGGDGSIVIFRDSEKNLDMESVLRASILKGLAESLVRGVSEKISQEGEDLDITLFYDTTHGINALLPPFSYAARIIDQVIVLELAKKLLETKHTGQSYSIRSYLYNSDPVFFGRSSEQEYVEHTFEQNISYYYRTLMRSSSLVSGLNQAKPRGKTLRSMMMGLLMRLSEARSVIDELVSSLLQASPNLNEGEGSAGIWQNAIHYIYSMYLAKLGLVHWSLKAFDELHSKDSGSSDTVSRLQPIIKMKFAKSNSPKSYEIGYRLNKEHYGKLPPHIIVTSLLLGSRLADYLLALYDNLEAKAKNGPGKDDSRQEGRKCIRIDTLRKLLEDLDAKFAGIEKYNAALALSALYTEIVEPSARILVLNEVERLRREKLEKILDHFLPRGFKLTIENCPPGTEAWETVLGVRALCIYPVSSLPSSSEHIRNFIAHAGLTRLSRNWCLAIEVPGASKQGSATSREPGEDEQGTATSKCAPLAICIEKPLDTKLLSEIVNP